MRWNGIERRFTPIHVHEEAQRRTSPRAAVVQAAYTALVALYPAQADALANDLQKSLAGITGDRTIDESSGAIQRGRVWGERVARDVLAWRSTDGLDTPSTPYLGKPARRASGGRHRPPCPPGGGLRPTPGAYAHVRRSHVSDFPPGLPSVGSPAIACGTAVAHQSGYAADVNEVKLVGELTSAVRTADQTSLPHASGPAPRQHSGTGRRKRPRGSGSSRSPTTRDCSRC